MPLTDMLGRLYARRRFGIKPGVDRVAKLLERLGNPEKKIRTIHVVGTNGKGSTSAFLSSILLEAGCSVAQFSSPHLVCFTERFKINGVEYSPEKLAAALGVVMDLAPDEATFFEIITALAAYVFSEENIEIAVMEAGMGGRSDATAAFNGEMTLVTPVSLDHTAYLGSTVEEIAREKAGITKHGTVMISAEQSAAVEQVVRLLSAERGCMYLSSGKDFSTVWGDDRTLSYYGINRTLSKLKPGIPGRYQSMNVAVALAAAEIFIAGGMDIRESALSNGVSSARWPGRMELIEGSPRLLLDGAHNPAGSSALAEALRDFSYSKLILVTGVCDDKDLEMIYKPLIPLVDAIYTVTPAVDRALSGQKLSEFFLEYGINSQLCSTVIDGITRARAVADAEDIILVCGSLFIVGEVKAWLEEVSYEGIRG
ncbi:MAG: bifunctional folylpolyglutamate synthase/dihydrofolate synthase [Desulfuromonadaceae bacterium]|nr:bifunctional folylpolyglutamate synthase/dihydrofolate synthase [Desulfuromonadaceae bacterium]MDD2854912.1 bifunctional folylpolyglutamate synthase/dihydrofolate synthase [Desulfuromonadaceae bacterium]